jgi:hypothetical protein
VTVKDRYHQELTGLKKSGEKLMVARRFLRDLRQGDFELLLDVNDDFLELKASQESNGRMVQGDEQSFAKELEDFFKEEVDYFQDQLRTDPFVARPSDREPDPASSIMRKMNWLGATHVLVRLFQLLDARGLLEHHEQLAATLANHFIVKGDVVTSDKLRKALDQHQGTTPANQDRTKKDLTKIIDEAITPKN